MPLYLFFLLLFFPFLTFTLAPSSCTNLPPSYFKSTFPNEPYTCIEPDGEYIYIPFHWKKVPFIYALSQIHENLHYFYPQLSPEDIGVLTLIQIHHSRDHLLTLLNSSSHENLHQLLTDFFNNPSTVYWIIESLQNSYFYSFLSCSLENSPTFGTSTYPYSLPQQPVFCCFSCLTSLNRLISPKISHLPFFASRFLPSLNSKNLHDIHKRSLSSTQHHHSIHLIPPNEVPQKITREWIDSLIFHRNDEFSTELRYAPTNLTIGRIEYDDDGDNSIAIFALLRGYNLGYFILQKHLTNQCLTKGHATITDSTGQFSESSLIGKRLYLHPTFKEIFTVFYAGPLNYYYYLNSSSFYQELLPRLQQKLDESCNDLYYDDSIASLKTYVRNKSMFLLVDTLLKKWDSIPLLSKEQLAVRESLLIKSSLNQPSSPSQDNSLLTSQPPHNLFHETSICA